ncbi:ABC transporter substrate-binding protein [Gracilibacillus kekensis]|uniref:Carbohydrate ABC transporter substrate-binding protein, CUT1 family n=1 Tax=Gracilibacillus kekensis TaxID=1027249 RepID=A0A1M7QWI3_9BACI|nr:extracellular solute-binding protein [Gracilibacillus kekensis]SHN36018.1 carbohydrate ABC transporter substrate-binding protein, CUT1 family [Gracilibacillus kekensis]
MKNTRITITLICLILLLGCQSDALIPFDQSSLALQNVEEQAEQKSDQLVIWTHENIFENSLPIFLERYPDLQVKIVPKNTNNLVEEYRSSLMTGQTPDLYVIPDEVLGEFSSIGGFENLYQEPYYDEKFFERRPEGLLRNYINREKQEMFAMPLLFFPYITFYRADILAEKGYPSDPDKLATLLNDEKKWMEMAQKLEDNDQYIIESEHMMLDMLLRTNYFLDKDYNYLGKENDFQTLTNAAIEVPEKGLSPYYNIWNENGQKAIQDDQLVMFQMGSYVMENLKEWVPEQKGKWGVTSMPFGLSGTDKKASMSIAIAEDSDNKEIAWEFAKQMANDMFYMYEQAENDPYYINNDLKSTFWKVLSNDTIGQPQPVDQQIQFIWDVNMKEFHSGTEVTKEAINKIHENIEERIKYDQRALKQLIQETSEQDIDK